MTSDPSILEEEKERGKQKRAVKIFPWQGALNYATNIL